MEDYNAVLLYLSNGDSVISRIIKPITDEQLKIISRIHQRPILNTIGFCFFCLMLITLLLMLCWFLLGLLLPNLKQVKVNSEIFIIIALPFAIYQAYKTHLKIKKLLPNNKSLQKEFVEELTIDAFRAIKVEEFEDEGIGYYLDIGEGKILFIQGQYLYDEDENGKSELKIPSTRMAFTRVVGSGILLDFKCLGNYLPPCSTIPPFTIKDFKKNCVPEDCTILEVDFESLKR
jgi:hypothetical protein